MKFIRASLTLKFFLFLILVSGPLFAVVFVLKNINPNEKMVFFGLATTFLLLALFGFILFVVRPLNRITPQVKALLTGKKYKRMRPLSPDEIGVFTHFFNEVTRNLEKISGDLLEQKRIFSELDLARQIQQDVLPKDPKNIEGLDIIAKSKPAAEMGGDSFDFIQRDSNTLIYIGDVTGHGVPAGLVMMMVNTLIHAYAGTDKAPHEILARVNDVLCDRISSQRFMTLVMLRWDALLKKLYYTGAGHEHLLVYRAKTKEVDAIRSGGIALRMTKNVDAILREQELAIEPDDVILLYTDGITEARNAKGEMFTLERLKNALKQHGFRASTENIFDKISEEFSDFVGANHVQDDDITMIVIKHLPDSSEFKQAVKMIVNYTDNNNMSVAEKWTW